MKRFIDNSLLVAAFLLLLGLFGLMGLLLYAHPVAVVVVASVVLAFVQGIKWRGNDRSSPWSRRL